MSSPPKSSDPLDDGFTSITWDNPPTSTPSQPEADQPLNPHPEIPHPGADPRELPGVARTPSHNALDGASREGEHSLPAWKGRWMLIEIRDPVKEHEGTKEMYVSYAVRTKTNAQGFPNGQANVRRRFKDFTFLQSHLSKNFPASVVPPIPDKHRLEYIKGDRFSPEFVEARRIDLQHFVDRISRHPTLQRSTLMTDFLTSAQWNVTMHKHIANPPPDSNQSLFDGVTDSLVNAFTKVRKPDERFFDMREGIEKFEEGLNGIEKMVGKERARTEDLSQDYVDLAASFQGLGYLESGITEPLNRFAERMLDFSTLLKDLDATAIDPFLAHVHSLLAYSQSHRSVIKLRDQKQLDFEELSAYLSAVVAERDRLAALNNGHSGAPIGFTTYLRDKVDQLRGTDDIHTRRERMKKLDVKITELQDAVTTAHETTTDFNDEILKEHNIFEFSKQEEMKEMLSLHADGQVDMHRKTISDWENVLVTLKRIKVDI